MRPSKLRTRLLSVHRWLGLSAGVIFTIGAATGAILVYADELQVLLDGRSAYTTGLIAPHEIEAAIAREMPGARVLRVRWPTHGPNAIFVRVVDGSRRRDFFLDGGSGRLVVPARHVLLHGIRRLHTGLFLGAAGTRLIQVSSCAVVLSLLLGVVLWWPGLLHVLSRLRVRLRSGLRACSLDLHQTLGVIALPLLLVMTVSGVLMHPLAMRAATRLLLGGASERSWNALRSSVPAAATPREVDLETAAIIAQSQEGRSQLIDIDFPLAPDGIVEIRLRRDDRSQSARLALDRYSGAVLSRQSLGYDDDVNTRLHFGLAGGPLVRALYVVACLIGFSLLPTGLTIWWLKRRPRG